MGSIKERLFPPPLENILRPLDLTNPTLLQGYTGSLPTNPPQSDWLFMSNNTKLKLISLERESSASTNEEESKDIKNIEVEESESTINGYVPYGSIVIDYHEIELIHSPEEAKSMTAYLLYSSGTTGVALKLGMLIKMDDFAFYFGNMIE
ncbi:hypothetical protein C2G38_2156096 [Gigaspora rosea]|uniref:Uncharacterized protein n=1 Tax=Gigaspora rosea TaxID=44941 RepID=A0A397W310_9GLOM|nr:hypothetical protein C2G38_2156096 [Gigaspora rosea]